MRRVYACVHVCVYGNTYVMDFTFAWFLTVLPTSLWLTAGDLLSYNETEFCLYIFLHRDANLYLYNSLKCA